MILQYKRTILSDSAIHINFKVLRNKFKIQSDLKHSQVINEKRNRFDLYADRDILGREIDGSIQSFSNILHRPLPHDCFVQGLQWTLTE